MAIRIRKIRGRLVALCAARTRPETEDIYLDDGVHHALTTKFVVDFESEGFLCGAADHETKRLMLEEEGD